MQNQIQKEENLYYNGSMFSMDGTLLCKISKKRLNWYLERGLASKVNDDPLEIKLNFQPKELCLKKKNFLIPMNNVCVVCGSTENLTKHHVVPKSFRRHLPTEVKSHFSHDVLLLCVEHHTYYESKSLELRTQLRDQYKVCDAYDTGDREKDKFAGYARSLIRHGDKMPPTKKEKLIQALSKVIDPTDMNQMQKLSEYRFYEKRIEAADQKIVEQCGSLDDFMILWRKHFVKCMEPKHLPEGWNAELRVLN